METPSIPLEFTCPNCGEHRIEEVQADVTVASDIHLSQSEDGSNPGHDYGEQTNDGGHVDRYQCKNCGWTILADTDDYEEQTQDGLDVEALIARVQEMNKNPEQVTKSGGEVSMDDLVQEFSESLRENGKFMERIWNEECPDEVVYEGDGNFRWK